MAISDRALPYGLRDVKLTPLNADGSAPSGTSVDLPASQTFSFSETEEFQELRGDDRVQASRGGGPILEWDLESGGISLEAYAIMAGGTVQTTGITPNVVKRYRKLATDSRPYFRAEGQAINDNGGDFHGIVYRCKADGALEGTLSDQEFWVTSASGKGYGSLEAATLDAVYDFVHNETATAIVTGNNEVQLLVVDATAGNFKLNYSAQTTADIIFNVTAANLVLALEALSNIGVGDIAVSNPVLGMYYITFQGALANTNVAKITVVAGTAPLTGNSATAAVTTINSGG